MSAAAPTPAELLFAQVERIKAGVSPTGDESTTVDATAGHLPAAFYEARPYLEHVRQAAYARSRSADLVLHTVFARVAAVTPHTIELPAIVGGPGCLNIYGAAIGPSGAGKSSGTHTGRELVPAPAGLDIADDRPIGSGEGIAELFMGQVEEEGPDGKKVKVRRQVRHHAFVYVDEGEALVDLIGRQGSTLLETLRRGWSGSALGQSNASADRNRVIPAGLYHLGLVVGFQPEKAEALLDDAAGGTPQRFLFCLATDPAVPDDAPPWPGPLAWSPPSTGQLRPLEVTDARGYRRHRLEVAGTIAREVRAANLAAVRGQATVSELDSHANLHRLKVAGILALLDDRLALTADDWDLAGEVWRTSCAVRDQLADTIRAHRAREEEHRLESHGRRAEVAEAARIAAPDKVARIAVRLANYVHDKAGEDGAARRDLANRLASTERSLLGGALEHAITAGWLTEQDKRYRAGTSRPS